MKAVGSAFVAGLLGVVIGSLTAQEPAEDDSANRSLPAGAIRTGTIEAMSLNSGGILGEGEPVVIYDGWVFLPNTRQFIPREQIAILTFERNDREPADDFGNSPDDDRRQRRGFRED